MSATRKLTPMETCCCVMSDYYGVGWSDPEIHRANCPLRYRLHESRPFGDVLSDFERAVRENADSRLLDALRARLAAASSSSTPLSETPSEGCSCDWAAPVPVARFVICAKCGKHLPTLLAPASSSSTTPSGARRMVSDRDREEQNEIAEIEKQVATPREPTSEATNAEPDHIAAMQWTCCVCYHHVTDCRCASLAPLSEPTSEGRNG